MSRAIPLSGEDAGRCEDPSGLVTYSIDTEGPSAANYLLVEIKRGKVSKVSIPDMPQVDVQMSESAGGARDGSDKIEEGRLDCRVWALDSDSHYSPSSSFHIFTG